MRESPLTLEELRAADAVLLTGSLRLLEAPARRRESRQRGGRRTLRDGRAMAFAGGRKLRESSRDWIPRHYKMNTLRKLSALVD